MRFWFRIHSLFRNLFRKQQVETTLDDELRAYAELLTDEKIAASMPASEARRGRFTLNPIHHTLGLNS